MPNIPPRHRLFAFDGPKVRFVHDDEAFAIAKQALNPASTEVKRVSNVTCDDAGSVWTADLAPVNGPKLTGFTTYNAAVAAEVDWLERNHLTKPANQQPA